MPSPLPDFATACMIWMPPHSTSSTATAAGQPHRLHSPKQTGINIIVPMIDNCLLLLKS
jgi:hypothetical protein